MKDVEKGKDSKIHFRMVFYPFLAFMYGIIVCRDLYSGDLEKIILTSIIFIVVAVVFSLNKRFISLLFMLLLFFVGNGFYFLGIKSYDLPSFAEKVCIEGRITDDIESINYGYNVLLDDVVINGKEGRKINLVISNASSRPSPGQRIVFEGKLEKIKPFTLKSFNSFSYRSGARYNSKISEKDIVFLDNIKTKPDETIRLAVRNVIYNHMSEENAGIAMAMLFGDKNDLNDEISNTYKNVGIIHILTVSGLHVGFLMAVVYGLLKKCRVNKYLSLAVSAMFIIFYVYLCGFTPSVMRAGIMAIVMITAKTFYHQYDSLNSLGLAGFIICFIKPLSPFDIGFLMSLFSVFSILCLGKMFKKFFSRFLPDFVASVIAVSLSAQIGILPFLAYFGGQVHLLSFMVNLVVLPLLSVLFPFLFVVSFIGTIIPFVGYLLGIVDYGFKFITLVARFFERSHLIIPISANYFALTVLFFLMILGISEFSMIEAYKKFALFSVFSFIIVVSLGFYHVFPIKTRSNVDYISSGSSYSVVLTSSKGDRMIVGYSYMLKSYQKAYYINNFDTYLSLDGRISGDFKNSIIDLKVKNFITYNSCLDYASKVPTESEVKIGSFLIKYKEVDDEVVGVIIKMDNQCIFVASENNLSYNIIENEIISKEHPSLVFVEKIVGDRNNFDYILTTNQQQENGDYCYQIDGNVKFLLKNNDWKMRGLD